jgi:type IV pilus assembly protein PilM
MGIEITDYAVKVVLLSNINSANIKLLAYTIEPLVGTCIEEGKIVDSFRLLQSIQIAVNRLDYKFKSAHFALPSPIVMVRFLKLPDLAKKDMDKMVDFEMKHNIHLPFEQPFYDYLKLSGASEEKLRKNRSSSKSSTVQPSKEHQQLATAQTDPLFGLTTGTQTEDSSLIAAQDVEQLCEVMLVAAPRERVEEYSHLIKNAQVELTSMEIKPLSLFRTIQSIDNNEALTKQTILLVDLGRIASDVSIFHEGKLKITRNIYINFPNGKDSNTVELAEDDPLSFLNITGGDNDFINACNELVHELERLVNFYRYTLNNRDHEFERLIVSGDVERMEEIRSHIEERLERKVSIISCKDVQYNDKDLKLIFPSIANAFGLALRGNAD